MVTAGVLQSVHRLAEGMIFAAATAERKDGKHHKPGGNADNAGQPPATTLGGRVSSGAGAPGGTNQSGDGEEAERRAEQRCTDTRQCAACGGEDNVDARDIVDNLVSTTAREYVRKAVAVAAPGPLKESVRRALCGGRDGMLKGHGDSVARDWERFFKNAAAAASPWETGGG